MRTRLAAGVVVAIVLGLLATLSAQSISGAIGDALVQCRYEIYGPVGEGWAFNDTTPREPVILLNQCTGDTWQLRGTGTASSWRAISVGR